MADSHSNQFNTVMDSPGGVGGVAGEGNALNSPGAQLSLEERSATEQFLENVNKWRRARKLTQLSWTHAIKFLMARKFNVERALILYQQHEIMRIREGLTYFDPKSGPLQKELLRGKFTILPTRDPNGATIAMFNASQHDPSDVTHQTVLQCVVFQLDVALEELETQRNGLVFVYNMSNSKYSNFDYDLSQKMLTLLKGCYPARLKKVLIVTAPLWFKAPFKVLRLFVREKLRDRVFTVSIPQLLLHVPASSLPPELGGALTYSHKDWLTKCNAIMDTKSGEMLTMTQSTSQYNSPAEVTPTHLPDEDLLGITNGVDGLNLEDEVEDDDITEPIAACTSLSPVSSPPHSVERNETAANQVNGKSDTVSRISELSSELCSLPISAIPPGIECLVSDSLVSQVPGQPEDSIIGSEGMNLHDFIVHVRTKTRNGLFDEYSEIKSQPPDGTFDTARLTENLAKNRYTDVLCYDHTRVILTRDDNDVESDYINANFVDGYKQRNAFISSQGPLPRTFSDFWQMVWEQRVLVVVMTTRTVERHRTKCGQYWPELEGTSISCGIYQIHSETIDNFEDFIITSLTVRNTSTDEVRCVSHFQFTSWPDYGTPESALSMLQFLQCVREKQASMLVTLGDSWSGHSLGPPIVVHCSAGIGRTGTFCTLDIAIRKFEDIGKVDVRTTVDCIRAQRAFSIQMPDQYVFCHLAFLEYVLNMGFVEEIDLTGFDENTESE